jgi:hypothetical protein
MAAFIITRIHVGDYDAWRPMFDQDRPRARERATSQRVFRGVEDPHHASGVLDRFEDKHGPNVVVEADAV